MGVKINIETMKYVNKQAHKSPKGEPSLKKKSYNYKPNGSPKTKD